MPASSDASSAFPPGSSATTMRRPRQPSISKDELANSTLGQFSFAPATHTTVVTTTTTTTTQFPPFVMKPPRHLRNLDPQTYPLASTDTPTALKKITFEFGGRQTIFREADDAVATMDELRNQQAALQASGGSIESKTVSNDLYDDQAFGDSPRLRLAARRLRPKRLRERPVSPVSIPEAPDHLPDSLPDSAKYSQFPISQVTTSTGPATPDTDSGDATRHANREVSRHLRTRSRLPHLLKERKSPRRRQSLQSVASDHVSDVAESFSPLLTDAMSTRTSSQLKLEAAVTPLEPEDTEDADSSFDSGKLEASRSSPPPIPRDQRSTPRPPRLPILDSPASQDISLPSPSLSPVTAAANLQLASGFFTPEDSSLHEPSFELPSRKHPEARNPTSNPQGFFESRNPASMTDIPAMFDYFEAIPDDLKKYVMHQLLRRCPKPTLRYVADMVNPSLKCDFLGLLPLELSLNIVGYLDVKSMCRASQTCKRWRHIINSDEKAWKELLDQDGFVIEDGELKRAIIEGWGWQHPQSIDGFETLISSSAGSRSDSEESQSSVLIPRSADASATAGPSTPTNRRSKRKIATRSGSRKFSKRKLGSSETSEKLAQTADWMAQLAASEGPYAAANAAALAVPFPNVGLPSLKSLHLFKSIYQRNYLVRQNWIREDVKPRHIAFRAHDRHVVTCLQFDTEKILTGSDDTNINVYDTKTGALRATLTGHEGGVWALQYEGNVLVSGSTDRTVRVWDIEQAKCVQTFLGHTSTVRCLQILMPVDTGKRIGGKPVMMPRQPLIITGSRDSNLRVWKLPQPTDANYVHEGAPQDDVECPYFVRTLSGHQHSVRAIAAHADTLVSGSYDCSVRVWRISTGETVHRLTGHAQKVYSVVLDHENDRCISGSMDSMVKIWSLTTGSVLYNLEGHSSLVGLLDLNCERLVSAAADSTLRIWDPETGQCKSILRAHTGAITCFQHDGQKVISGSDRTLKMWDVHTGQCVRDLLTDLSGVWQVKFNDRRCVAAVQRDSLTYIEVIDFGACRDSSTEDKRGRRIVVNARGAEVKQFPAILATDADD